MVIFTDLGQRQKSAYFFNAEDTTNLPKTLQIFLYIVFHNLKFQKMESVRV